jgi:hypothetical protein
MSKQKVKFIVKEIPQQKANVSKQKEIIDNLPKKGGTIKKTKKPISPKKPKQQGGERPSLKGVSFKFYS